MVRNYIKKIDVSFEHVSTTMIVVDSRTKGYTTNILRICSPYRT